MKWTAEREDKLRQLWKKGHSGSQIARLLGEGATRNSVLGKAFRLKLEARAVTKKTTSRTNSETDNSLDCTSSGLVWGWFHDPANNRTIVHHTVRYDAVNKVRTRL